MTNSAPLPKGDPRIIAWEAYRTTPEYANTRNWALHKAHVDGSLWAAFLAGYEAQAALNAIASEDAALGVENERLREALRLIADENSWRGFSPQPIVERMREHAARTLTGGQQ